MAQITHTLKVEMDLNKPVEELAQIISSVLSAHPGREQEILSALDLEVYNALAAIEVVEKNEETQNI